MKIRLFLAIMLLVGCATTGMSHHSFAAVYDDAKLVTLSGVVTEFKWLNPHSQLYFDVKDKDGKVVTWGAEMRAPGNLVAEGYTRKELLEKLKPGTEVTVTGNPSKSGAPVLVFIKLKTTDGYCLCNNGGGGAIPKEGVDENLKYSGTPPAK